MNPFEKKLLRCMRRENIFLYVSDDSDYFDFGDDDESAVPLSVEVRGYDGKHLNEIVLDETKYHPELVSACRKEIEIRKNSIPLRPEVSSYPDDRIAEILSNRRNYREELVYCCQVEKSRRDAVRRKEALVAAEKAKEEREKAKEAARIKRLEEQKIAKAKFVKGTKITLVVMAIIAVIAIVIYLFSDTHKYRTACRLYQKGKAEKAMEKFATVRESSEYYSISQYLLFLDLIDKRDSVSAGEALRNSVKKENWDCPEAYDAYLQHIVNGTMRPYINTNEYAAASLYEKSPRLQDLIRAGELWFRNGDMKKAYDIFSKNTWSGEAKGYIGIMYLYGLAGLERSASTAYKYLSDAPDVLPFVVHKGDLILFLRNKSGYSGKSWEYIDMAAIQAAARYYETARTLNPENISYIAREKALKDYIAASRKHDNDDFNPTIRWDSYFFGNLKGYYSGEVVRYGNNNNTRGAHGCGMFTFDDYSVNIGKFSYCKNIGAHIQLLARGKDQYAVYAGYYSKEIPTNGAYTFENGQSWVGKFKPDPNRFDLADGVFINAEGKQIRRLKK
mgnify:FL=1